MIIVQNVLVSDELVEEFFQCNLNVCKGACCWEGDFGAPLENEEINQIERLFPLIKPILLPEAQDIIEREGTSKFYEEQKSYGTSLLENGACVFMIRADTGIAKCGIEKAYELGLTDFQKPISCHLYPIRIAKNEEFGFTALNYDRWDICEEACTLGKAEKVSVYKFAKAAIVRKFGNEFYEELDNLVKWMMSKNG